MFSKTIKSIGSILFVASVVVPSLAAGYGDDSSGAIYRSSIDVGVAGKEDSFLGPSEKHIKKWGGENTTNHRVASASASIGTSLMNILAPSAEVTLIGGRGQIVRERVRTGLFGDKTRTSGNSLTHFNASVKGKLAAYPFGIFNGDPRPSGLHVGLGLGQGVGVYYANEDFSQMETILEAEAGYDFDLSGRKKLGLTVTALQQVKTGDEILGGNGFSAYTAGLSYNW
jgi:hypothetical protein